MELEKEKLQQEVHRLDRLLKIERADKLQNASAFESLHLELLGTREKVGPPCQMVVDIASLKIA